MVSNALDSRELREAAAAFCTGVAVITALSGAGPVGMTVQSFVSLSLDPPYASFCPSRTSTTWPLLRAARRLAINVLAADQEEVSRQFSTSGTGSRFNKVRWSPGANGAPLLAGSLACFEARLHQELPGGDHTIAVLELTRAQSLRDADPLLYFRSAYRSIAHTAPRSEAA